MTHAVLVATAAAESGGPAALLSVGGATLLGRLHEQLQDQGVVACTVLTRPEWRELCDDALPAEAPVDVIGVGTLAASFEGVASVAERTDGPVLLLQAEVTVHGSVLAGLLSDPRVATGAVTSAAVQRQAGVFQIRTDRGRVTSAESPYHAITRPTGMFLGMLKVAPADLPALAAAASELGALCRDALPPRWEPELALKVATWGEKFFRKQAPRAALAEQLDREAGSAKWLPDPTVLRAELDADFRSEVLHRAATAGEDAIPILLTAMVRSGAVTTSSYLRDLFWARPLSQEQADAAGAAMAAVDEDRAMLDSAVKGIDGFFTTFFVSPYSRYLARWAARHGLTPNQVTTLSLVLGALAAAAFAVGSRPGLVAGALLLQVAFTTDCVDGQLARYTRRFSKLGAWLDSVFDRGKEYLVYAGLAIGAARGGDDGIWLLAGAALALQTFRHVLDFSYAGQQHLEIAALPSAPLPLPEDRLSWSSRAQDLTSTVDDGADVGTLDEEAPLEAGPSQRGAGGRTLGRLAIEASVFFEQRPWMKWAKRIFVLPIGERFALISLTAALGGPRATFVALLAWASAAALYTGTGRVLRSIA